MNMTIFRLINNLAFKNKVLDEVMILFSKYVPYFFMAIIAVIFISGIIRNRVEYRKVSVSAAIITVINLFLGFLIGSIYYVDRPFVHNKVNLLFPHVEDASLPSDHAIGTMSIALGLGKFNKHLSIILSLLSLIVGFSRIYVGHHYPLDVITAYILVFAVNFFYNLKLRNKVEKLYEKLEKNVTEKFKQTQKSK